MGLPRFIADLSTGGAVPLRHAAAVLRPGDGPASRRALARLRTLPGRLPGESAATAYVILDGALPAEVESVRMVVARGGADHPRRTSPVGDRASTAK